MFWSNKNGFETSHYLILAYFVFTLTGYDVCRSYCEAELLRGKVIQLGPRDTNQLWECIQRTNQLIPENQYPVIYIIKFSNN